MSRDYIPASHWLVTGTSLSLTARTREHCMIIIGYIHITLMSTNEEIDNSAQRYTCSYPRRSFCLLSINIDFQPQNMPLISTPYPFFRLEIKVSHGTRQHQHIGIRIQLGTRNSNVQSNNMMCCCNNIKQLNCVRTPTLTCYKIAQKIWKSISMLIFGRLTYIYWTIVNKTRHSSLVI